MELLLHSPLDMHCHLREGEMLGQVATATADCFAAAVVMPNLRSPVDSLPKLLAYRQAIVSACGNRCFLPFMTLFFRNYSRKDLEEAKPHVFGIKLYPAGITTQSEQGIRDFSAISETLSHMEELGLPLLVHGESGGFVLDREREFLAVYDRLAREHPRLHIVMEHITTQDAVTFVDRYDNVSATVTLHHLLITLDDLLGDRLEPDLFCKPIAKTPRDRGALREAVLAGHPRLMFGSDSAPHPRHHKECCGCAAGIFSAPVALPMLAELFEEAGCLERLQGFVSEIAQARYRITPPPRQIRLIDSPWTVPELVGQVRPFAAGSTLRWSIASDTSS